MPSVIVTGILLLLVTITYAVLIPDSYPKEYESQRLRSAMYGHNSNNNYQSKSRVRHEGYSGLEELVTSHTDNPVNSLKDVVRRMPSLNPHQKAEVLSELEQMESNKVHDRLAEREHHREQQKLGDLRDALGFGLLQERVVHASKQQQQPTYQDTIPLTHEPIQQYFHYPTEESKTAENIVTSVSGRASQYARRINEDIKNTDALNRAQQFGEATRSAFYGSSESTINARYQQYDPQQTAPYLTQQYEPLVVPPQQQAVVETHVMSVSGFFGPAVLVGLIMGIGIMLIVIPLFLDTKALKQFYKKNADKDSHEIDSCCPAKPDNLDQQNPQHVEDLGDEHQQDKYEDSSDDDHFDDNDNYMKVHSDPLDERLFDDDDEEEEEIRVDAEKDADAHGDYANSTFGAQPRRGSFETEDYNERPKTQSGEGQ